MLSEETIKKEWFPNHIAELRTYKAVTGPDILYLGWKKPETNVYGVEYLIKGTRLIVSGDIGDATYWWSGRISFESIAGMHVGYFASKCEASEYGRQFKSWQRKVLEKNVDVALRQRAEYSMELDHDDAALEAKFQELKALFEKHGGIDAISEDRDFFWHSWLAEHASKVFGDDWWEFAPDGLEIDVRCMGHLVGVKAAMEQLQEKSSE